MTPPFARHVIALSATMAPDLRDRVIGVIVIAGNLAEAKRPAWWRWTVWMAIAITIARIEAA